MAKTTVHPTSLTSTTVVRRKQISAFRSYLLIGFFLSSSSAFLVSRSCPRIDRRSSCSLANIETKATYATRSISARMVRTQVSDVSVSEEGFCVFLPTSAETFVPLVVTKSDTHEVVSAEALTLCQLLVKLDLAGAILPPDVLSKVAVLTLERGAKENSDKLVPFLEDIYEQTNGEAFSSLQPWMRSRIRLPKCSLDMLEYTIDPEKKNDNSIILQIKSQEDDSSFAIPLLESVVKEVVYEYIPDLSRNFLAISLALRYQCPINLELKQSDSASASSVEISREEIKERFPLHRSIDQLNEKSDRVTTNIERSFKIHKLQAALRIALERQDVNAATKIRAQLDKFDNFDDLPVQPESDTDTMQ